MSEGIRIPLAEAQNAAQVVLEILRPYCLRCEIAGSVRRGKPDVGDVEIVCIPKPSLDLFGNATFTAAEIEGALHAAGWRMPKFNGEHFKQFSLGAVNCDLFITTPECWGMIYTIRTGPAEFSHRLVTQKNKGGLLPSYMSVKEGRLIITSTGEKLETPEECDVFRLTGIDPNERRKQ